ncbi:DUF1178 family protein [Stappia sp. F7233]|uniref:DUF1178 family protein n=1 Tax=Stappia albiluteola TaxID=2758565 RepID=A0A839AHV3_9HYPH|nr:DUF1178 family protein [Stappia albiluteola]MBA5778715.1 DUF1178 family protein [Stappia albiluteola]
MIRFSLACAHGHAFDGWFRSSDDFESQKARQFLSCPACGSHEVGKALMAPNVSTSRKRSVAVAEAVAASSTGKPAEAAETMAAGPSQAELIEKLREIKRELVAKSDYVGEAFAEEARKIHYGEVESRGIYGEASPDSVRELVDEGIAVVPLPVLPEERN